MTIIKGTERDRWDTNRGKKEGDAAEADGGPNEIVDVIQGGNAGQRAYGGVDTEEEVDTEKGIGQ